MDELAKKLASATTEAEQGYVYKELEEVLGRLKSKYLYLPRDTHSRTQ